MAGTNRGAPEACEDGPYIILVRPQLGENIGASARAMLNFGLARMRIVAPRDGWPNPSAEAMASGATAVLERAEVFDTLEAAVADLNFLAATTVRPRDMNLPVYRPDRGAVMLRERIGAGEGCGILFGGERAGLSADEIEKADVILTADVNPAFGSINLAQAVLLIGYEWRRSGAEYEPVAASAEPPAVKAEVEGLIGHLNDALDASGYYFPPEKAPSMAKNLRVMLTRAGFSEPEIRTFRGVIKSLARHRQRSD